MSQSAPTCCPGPSQEVSPFQPGSFTSFPPTPASKGKVRVPQVPHITPQLRPPVQPKASQHVASGPPVVAGRRNVTHIIIHHSGEMGKEGRDMGRDGGGGAQGQTLFVQGS